MDKKHIRIRNLSDNNPCIQRKEFWIETRKPFESWIFDEDICSWTAPIPKPSTGFWRWNEETQEWIDNTPEQLKLDSVSFE